jgi:hypothetical protein
MILIENEKQCPKDDREPLSFQQIARSFGNIMEGVWYIYMLL